MSLPRSFETLIVLFAVSLIASTGCNTTPTAPPSPAPVPTPIPTPSALPAPQPEVKSVKLTDPVADLFDKAGKPNVDEPYIDIVSADLASFDTYYLATIKLNGLLPAKFADTTAFLEWDFLVDADSMSATGWRWPLICNDIGPDYLFRLEIKGESYTGSYKGTFLDIKQNKWGAIEFKIDGDTITLQIPKTIIQGDSFDYVFAVRKYIIGSPPDAPRTSDKAPNDGHCNFPKGCDIFTAISVDTDKDGFSDDEETSALSTDPKTAEKWDDLATVTKILNTPEKINLYLKQKFTEKRMPSQLFAESIMNLFSHKSGDCDEYARLALHWLSENGYESYLADIYFNKWWQEYNQWLEHDICVYKGKDGLWRSFDIYDFGHNPKGPFKSVDEIISQLPGHYGATDWKEYTLYDTWGKFISKKAK